MTNRYKILFAVELLNDYYNDGICNDFNFLASAETTTLLKNYQLLYKVVNNTLLVLIKVDDTDIPFLNIDENVKFVFYLDLQKPSFISFTNIDLETLRTSRFYFTNINQNKSGDLLNISAPIPAYKNTIEYRPGAFADDGTHNIFEALETTSANTSTNAWTAKGENQFVSSADAITPSTKIFNYTAPVAATQFDITAFSFNTTNGFYDVAAKTFSLQFDTATKNIQVDLSSLKNGKYRITINTDELFFYLDDINAYAGYFGVVEIFSYLPNTNDFSFFNTQGNLKQITYSIRFANRRAFWKYISNLKKIDNIKRKGFNVTPFTASSSDPVGHPGRKDFFTSNDQLLISESPDENNFELVLAHPLESVTPDAPKPDLTISGMLTQQEEIFYCNIYLNY